MNNIGKDLYWSDYEEEEPVKNSKQNSFEATFVNETNYESMSPSKTKRKKSATS